MLEEYFSDKLVLSSIRNSVLQKSLEKFAQHMMNRGHTPPKKSNSRSVFVVCVATLSCTTKPGRRPYRTEMIDSRDSRHGTPCVRLYRNVTQHRVKRGKAQLVEPEID